VVVITFMTGGTALGVTSRSLACASSDESWRGQQKASSANARRAKIKPTAGVVDERGRGFMARIRGLEQNEAPWHLRWFYRVLRKMFGKELTPVKLQMRLPGIVWGSIAMEAGLGRKRRVSLRHIQLAKVRTAARVGCPF
jgi:hypothetical protein